MAMRPILRVLRFVGFCVAALGIIVLTYLAVALLFLLFPANGDFKPLLESSQAESQVEAGVRIYVMDNGVHTDLVLPVASTTLDWSAVFPKNQFAQVAKTADLIAFGWGDAEFYLHTPNWSDLKFTTAIRALVGANPTLLHVEYLETEQLPDQVFALDLSASQYRALSDYILASMPRSTNSWHMAVAGGYGESDAFFNANGTYSVVQTCNTWTGAALAHAGVKVSRWTPFPALVTWYLPQTERTAPLHKSTNATLTK